MSGSATQKIVPQNTIKSDWDPPIPPSDLIYDDGEPLESNNHRIAMNALIRSLVQAYGDRDDYFVGGNMFLYYSSKQVRNQDFRGPDFFAVLDVDGTKQRKSWILWEEDGRYPNAIIELMSASTAHIDVGEKKDIYEQVFRTPDYFVFDPFDANSLRGWHLTNGFYQPLAPNQQGWLWCESLGLWLGTWQGTITKQSGVWLRFYDRSGNLIPLPEEAANQRADAEHQKAEAERQKAERLAARLRELGEDPNNI